MLTHHGVRPLEFMASLGWTGPDVWYAHGVHFNDEELRELARTGTGVAHCPISNMKLSSGVARIPEMLALGVPVGLAVDGSASNDGSSLMEELRVAYLLHRLNSSKAAPSGYQVLKMATRGSMDLSKKDGGLPPDSVVQTVDEIMKDSVRIIEQYHDPRPGSMRQVALAPCSPFSVSAELLRQSAILARQYGVRLHTHLCETKDE